MYITNIVLKSKARIIQFYFLDIFYSTLNNLKQHLYIKAHIDIPQDRIFKKNTKYK